MSTSGMHRRPFEGRHLVVEYISTLTSILKKFDEIDFFRSIKEFMLIN